MGAFTSAGVRAHAPACWFPLAHAEAIAAHPGLELVAVADVDAEAAARAAEAHGAPRWYTEPLAMLAEAEPDVLCIATRTPGRAALIEAAVAAGVRALHVEKPLCNSMAELVRLEALFAKDSVHMTWGAIRRLMRPYQAALAEALGGRHGALLEAQVHMGAGALFWTHPHSFDLLLFAADGREVQDVSAVLGGVEPDPTDPLRIHSDPRLLSVTLRFADGLIGRIGRQPGCDWVLAGETGAVAVEADGHRLMRLSTEGAEVYPAWRPLQMSAGVGPSGTQAALVQLLGCLDHDRHAEAANRSWKRDMLMAQRLLFACVESDRQGGRPIAPDEVPAGLVVDALKEGRPA
jgi:predicted dehydrogenase